MSVSPSFSGGRRSNVFDPYSLDAWDSFRNYPFPSSWVSSWDLVSGREALKFTCPQDHWKDTPEAHVFTAEIPGFKKEQVKVEIIKDYWVLQISGERSLENEKSNGSPGRSSGKFMKRCSVPKRAVLDQAKASIKNDVLTITIPKVEMKESDVILVEITD